MFLIGSMTLAYVLLGGYVMETELAKKFWVLDAFRFGTQILDYEIGWKNNLLFQSSAN